MKLLFKGGAASFPEIAGSTINNTNGTLTFNVNRTINLPVSAYRAGETDFKGLVSAGINYEPYQFIVGAENQITVDYAINSDVTVQSFQTLEGSGFRFILDKGNQIIDGSITFTADSTLYKVVGQNIYVVTPGVNFTQGAVVGKYDYTDNTVLVYGLDVGSTMSVKSGAIYADIPNISQFAAVIPTAPIQPGSVTIFYTDLNGVSAQATCDNNGVFAGVTVEGKVDLLSGYMRLSFGKMVTVTPEIETEYYYDAAQVVSGQIWQPLIVNPDSVRFNAVGSKFTTVDSDLLGADLSRLPSDGRVPCFKEGRVVVILNDSTTSGTYASNQVVTGLGANLNKITVYDNLGVELPNAAITATNLTTGSITFGALAGFSQPLSIVSRIESTHLITDVQVPDKLEFSPAVSKSYPVGSLVCSAATFGDLFANVSVPFTQQTWLNHWLEIPEGNPTLSNYDTVNNPILVNNYDCMYERWAIIMASPSTYNLVGEHVGQIITGHSITAPLTPVNPLTGNPYFTLPANSIIGFSTGNVIRFNTNAASKGVAVIKSVTRGTQTSADFKFCLETRLDVNEII